MTTIAPNTQNNIIPQLLNQAFQSGQLDPNTIMMLLQFLQSRTRGQQPNPMQRQALGQARQQFGAQFRQFIQQLMRGNLGQFTQQGAFPQGVGAQPGGIPQGIGAQPIGGQQQQFAGQPGAFAGARGNNAWARSGGPGGGARAAAFGPGATAMAKAGGKHCATGNQPIANQQQAANNDWQNNVLKGGKGGWLAKHGCYKKGKDGSYNITKGQYKDHTAVPMGKGKFQVNGPDGKPVGVFNAPKGKDKIASPLTFDLNGDGKVGTTAANKDFDINGDGKVDKSGWAAKGDGVLAFDGDGDGKAGTNGKELLGNNTDTGDGKKYANGFDALKGLAERHLGKEATADGKLDERELAALEKKTKLGMIVNDQWKSLGELGVESIDLGFKEAGRAADEHGNEHRQQGSFKMKGEDQARKVNDVWYKYQ